MNPNRWTLALISTAALLLLVAGPSEAKKKSLHDIPLQWTPTDDIGETFGGVDLKGLYDVKFRVEDFTDERAEGSLIGENREDEDEGTVLQVTTSSDVGAFVSDSFSRVFSGIGLSVGSDGADVVLEGEVRQFFVTEESTYKADIAVLVTATDASGNELWKGLAGGDATRFGRSYKAENYYEVLSDATMEAISSLLQNRGFRDAVASK